MSEKLQVLTNKKRLLTMWQEAGGFLYTLRENLSEDAEIREFTLDNISLGINAEKKDLKKLHNKYFHHHLNKVE